MEEKDILWKIVNGEIDLQAYSSLTGEVIDIHTDINELVKMLTFKNVSKRHRQLREQVKYYYEDKIMIFQKMLMKALKDLNGMEMKVFLYLLSLMDFENYIHISQKDIGKELDMHVVNVNKAIKGLREKGYVEIIKKGSENYYRISPEIAWKGSEKSHFKVLKEKNPFIT